MNPIDLRSDTVTLPTEDMRRAMRRAEVGDDGRSLADGRGGDPTVNALEERAAALLGKPAALFTASGTMANLVALRTWCPRGAPVAVGRTSHIHRREAAVFDDAYLGLRPVELDDAAGLPTGEAVRAAVRDHGPALLCLENTHNAAGGAAWTPRQASAVHRAAAAADLPVHLDGARLFNAAVALGVRPAELVEGADSVMFCLTKSLGAPVGALLLGEAGYIGRARQVRKLLGGQMRQVGVVAAAGLVALNGFADVLAADHRRARRLAELLDGHADPGSVRTNIVRVPLPSGGPAPQQVIDALARRGVLVQSAGDRAMRLVTHRDLTDADIERAARTLCAVLGQSRREER